MAFPNDYKFKHFDEIFEILSKYVDEGQLNYKFVYKYIKKNCNITRNTRKWYKNQGNYLNIM